MVTGKIVNYDPEKNKFWIEKEKAQYLTRKTNTYNFSASMQWIPILAQVEDEIIKCFSRGGGVPYSSYKRFHEVMAEESYQTVVVGLIEHILPLIPNIILSLNKGIKVLDIGCGKGKAVNLLAKNFPKSTFYGFDLSEEAINGAVEEAQELKNLNISFKMQDVLDFTSNDKFDLIFGI